jgi:hypothetical protein
MAFQKKKVKENSKMDLNLESDSFLWLFFFSSCFLCDAQAEDAAAPAEETDDVDLTKKKKKKKKVTVVEEAPAAEEKPTEVCRVMPMLVCSL